MSSSNVKNKCNVGMSLQTELLVSTFVLGPLDTCLAAAVLSCRWPPGPDSGPSGDDGSFGCTRRFPAAGVKVLTMDEVTMDDWLLCGRGDNDRHAFPRNP